MWPFSKQQTTDMPKSEAPKTAPKMPWQSAELLARSRINRRGAQVAIDQLSPLAVPEPPPYVRQYGHKLALDQNLQWADGFLTGPNGLLIRQNFGSVAWPGFAALAQWAAVPEFMLVSESFAEHATRKGFELVSTSEKDLSKQVEELSEELDRLEINRVLHDVVLYDGLYGRAHTYLDTGVKDPEELLFDIGDGSDKKLISRAKIKEGSLRCIKVLDPFWVYPQNYNAARPIEDDFYEPTTWLASGDMMHRSRCLPWISTPVPMILRPAWQFAGISRTQMCYDVVVEYRRNRTAVADLLDSFNVRVLKTDLSAMLNPSSDIAARVEFFNNFASNQGCLLMNKDTEEFAQISAPLGGLSDLAAQAAERLCMVAKIPMAFLFGTTAKGLNATSEPEIEIFNNHVAALQRKFLEPNLTKLIRFAQLNIWGRVNPNIGIRWVELFEMSEKDRGEHNKNLAETDRTLANVGAISPVEIRQRVAADPSSGYNNLDVEDVPEPRDLERDMGADQREGERDNDGGA
jgi:phage-related protein (TIGR01555 family)